jgi:glucan phosphoethanolaminetransferase (alkaline phosphatase superfamily)
LFLVLITSYIVIYDYPIPIIFTSLLIVFCLYSGVVWIITALGLLITNYKSLKIISSALFTFISFSIILTFALNFISNSNWGTNVTFKFIVKYSQQIFKLEEVLPLPLNLILLLSKFTVFFIYYKNISGILIYTYNLSKIITTRSSTPKESLYSILSVLVIPFLIFTYHKTQADHANDMWDGEPLTDLLLPYTTITVQKKGISPQEEIISASKSNNISNKPNIIVIIADALRADHLGTYGYKRNTSKFIDSLINSNKAIKIDNAFATCAESNCGILSTLSSRPYEEIATNNIKINNILKEHDYDVNFILSADHTWAGLKEHYPPYDLFYDGNDNENFLTDDQLVLDKLSTITNYKKPSFFYFHLMSTHSASNRKKEFEKFTPTKSPNDWFYRLPIIKDIFGTDKVLLETNFYDNGILATDYYIEQIFKQLTKKGYIQNSIIWIVADHGEAIGEHGHFGHIGNLYNEEIKIPMIIVDSKVDIYKERNFATQLDIAPTILDRIGIDIPKNWKGTSLLKKKEGTFVTEHNVPDREGNKALIMKTDDNLIFKMLYTEQPIIIKGVFNLTSDADEKNDLNKAGNEPLIKKFMTHLQMRSLESKTKVVRN